MLSYSRKIHNKNFSTIKKTNKLIINSIKSQPCKDCKIIYAPYCMDYDHINDNKSGNVSQISQSANSIKDILYEIDKCELVCANCHRQRTHSRYLSKKSNIKLSNYKIFYINLKESNPCNICNKKYKYYQMDYDHLPGFKKLYNISKISNVEKLTEEIKKCQLLCANCHRAETHNRYNKGEKNG
jgi:hypothetical protein